MHSINSIHKYSNGMNLYKLYFPFIFAISIILAHFKNRLINSSNTIYKFFFFSTIYIVKLSSTRIYGSNILVILEPIIHFFFSPNLVSDITSSWDKMTIIITRLQYLHTFNNIINIVKNLLIRRTTLDIITM